MVINHHHLHHHEYHHYDHHHDYYPASGQLCFNNQLHLHPRVKAFPWGKMKSWSWWSWWLRSSSWWISWLIWEFTFFVRSLRQWQRRAMFATLEQAYLPDNISWYRTAVYVIFIDMDLSILICYLSTPNWLIEEAKKYCLSKQYLAVLAIKISLIQLFFM